jgi:hypothetical protein
MPFPSDSWAPPRPATVEWTFHSLRHVTQRDLGRASCEGVPPSRPALARHEAGAAKALEDLLEIAGGNALTIADHPDLDRFTLPVVCEVKHSTYGILELEGQSHLRTKSARMDPAMPLKT